MNLYINIHKHGPELEGSGRELINISSHFDQIPQLGSYSAGLHPWYLKKESIEADWLSLVQVSQNENILAMGECGLDKVCDTELSLQEYWFIKQIHLAEEYKKPLIIHCVRAFDDVIDMLKMNNITVPVIFHGFNKGLSLAQKIVSNGYYLSFGRHLIDNQTIQDIFRQIPAEKLFLETDAAEVSISSVYRAAAAAMNVVV